MKAVLAFVLLVAVVAAAPPSTTDLQQQFVNWTQQHGKVYSTDEFQYRWQTWESNALFVYDHNTNSNSSFTVEMNKFADLNGAEFAKIYKGLAFERAVLHPTTSEVVVNVDLPASVDWRKHGAVTGIKNQGQCGSCWSFSTTGSVEGAHVLQAKKGLVGLSEQNLVDCSTSFGNDGCNGGLMDDAFKYIISNKGIDTESSYPYHAKDEKCHFERDHVGATIETYKNVPSRSEKDLQSASAEVGPISVAIDASHSSFQLYHHGVYDEKACSSTALDHGVLVVGYGKDGATPYWLVKNSWGTDWGINGYIMMSRDRDNQCGIATMASYPCADHACKA
eukprot:TRINITY_DN93_c0_g1_i1.p1 TRINITY_DN93_c0_g1~~TRINITY_DN93_c0_g1_i1.p1  ORF type:complete len:335 (+),score=84.29 TRINITY_DN93_c0_g1_i1:351-1355(+)